MSVDVSVIIVTLRDEILPVEYFEAGNFDDYEVIIRRDSGIATARNRGIEEASADKVLFIDDDAKPCQSYLAIASRLLDQHPAITGRVVQPPNALSSDWEFSAYDQGTEPSREGILIGCNMGFRRRTLEAVGYFDERFEFGNEELELGDRLREEFYIYYEPELLVEHTFAESRRQYWKKEYQKGKSDIKWMKKRGEGKRQQIEHIASYTHPNDVTHVVGTMCRCAGQISEFL